MTESPNPSSCGRTVAALLREIRLFVDGLYYDRVDPLIEQIVALHTSSLTKEELKEIVRFINYYHIDGENSTVAAACEKLRAASPSPLGSPPPDEIPSHTNEELLAIAHQTRRALGQSGSPPALKELGELLDEFKRCEEWLAVEAEKGNLPAARLWREKADTVCKSIESLWASRERELERLQRDNTNLENVLAEQTERISSLKDETESLRNQLAGEREDYEYRLSVLKEDALTPAEARKFLFLIEHSSGSEDADNDSLLVKLRCISATEVPEAHQQ